MLSRAEVLAAVQAIARELLEAPGIELGDGRTVDDIPEWDSISHVQIMVAVEERFGIQFSVAELSDLAHVGELIDVVIARCALNERRSPAATLGR